MIPKDINHRIRVMDFERLYKCSNNEGSNSIYLNSILKALDFLFLFHDVFFFPECFRSDNDYKDCVAIYKLLQDYITTLLPAKSTFTNVPKLYNYIRSLFVYEFPHRQSVVIQRLDNKLREFDNRLKSLYNENVKWWDTEEPETFRQYTLNRKYNSI